MFDAPPENIQPDGQGGYTVLVPPPKPIDSFDHGVIEDSDLSQSALENEVVDRLNRIVQGSLEIMRLVTVLDRTDLAHVLANLNAATVHVEDCYGC